MSNWFTSLFGGKSSCEHCDHCDCGDKHEGYEHAPSDAQSSEEVKPEAVKIENSEKVQ